MLIIRAVLPFCMSKLLNPSNWGKAVSRSKLPPAQDSVDKQAYMGPLDAAARLGVSPSTVKKMIESGTLKAWRTEGGHRRISIESIEAAAQAPRRISSQPQREKLLVLIAEDNPVMLKAYTRLFAEWEDSVDLQTAGDAAEALLAIAQRLPDVVITDLAMKPFDGFHLIRTVRSSPELRHVRIVVVTGLTPEQIEEKGGLPPSVLRYSKPLSNDRLRGYIEALLQTRLVAEQGD